MRGVKRCYEANWRRHGANGKPLADTKGALHDVFMLILLLQAQTERTTPLQHKPLVRKQLSFYQQCVCKRLV